MNKNDKFHLDAQNGFELSEDMLGNIAGGYSLDDLPDSIYCPYCQVDVPKSDYSKHLDCLQKFLNSQQ